MRLECQWPVRIARNLVATVQNACAVQTCDFSLKNYVQGSLSREGGGSQFGVSFHNFNITIYLFFGHRLSKMCCFRCGRYAWLSDWLRTAVVNFLFFCCGGSKVSFRAVPSLSSTFNEEIDTFSYHLSTWLAVSISPVRYLRRSVVSRLDT